MIDRVVSDSTCLIALERIGRLPLLPALIAKVVVPEAVNDEVGWEAQWLHVQSVQDRALVGALSAEVDPGEAEAIALAVELGGERLILDDKKGRRAATRLGIAFTGTVGLIVRAKREGLLDQARPVLDDLMEVGFHLTPALYQTALKLAGE